MRTPLTFLPSLLLGSILSLAACAQRASTAADLDGATPWVVDTSVVPIDGSIPNGTDGGATVRPRDASLDSARAITCGVPITSDSVIDLDVRAVVVQGRITFQGMKFPSGESLGSLRIGGTTANLVRDAAGNATFAVRVVPGTYDFVWGPGSSASEVLPANGATLRENVAVTSDSAIDLDVRAVTVQGTLTFQGARFPAGESLGSLRVGSVSAMLARNAAGNATFGVRVFPGTYDFAWGPSSTTSTVLPVNGATLREDVALTSDSVIDLDVRAFTVQGTLTFQGARFPASESLGSLRVGSVTASLSRNAGGSATFAVRVVPGTYDFAWGPSSTTSTILPVNGAMLREDVAVASDSVIDLDVRAVTVQGTLTFQGARFPASESLGTLRVGSVTASLSRNAGGGATFAVRITPGTYDFAWGPSSTSSTVLPVNGITLREDVVIASDSVIDLDVRAVTVQGTLTFQGAGFPAGESLGSLRIGAASAVLTRDASGGATFAVRITPGTYDIAWGPSSTTSTVLPQNGAMLRPDVAIASDSVIDLDVRAVTVQGTLTFQGARFPAGESLGGLRVGSVTAQLARDASGNATFGARVTPDTYEFSWNPSSTTSDLLPKNGTVLCPAR